MMLTDTSVTPAGSPVPGVIPEPITGPVANGAPEGRHANLGPTRSIADARTGGETRGSRMRRKAHRARLHGYAIATAVLVGYLVALAASNTAHVKANWVFGSSHVSIVWLVLFAAVLGWLLGLVATAAFHWRTRAPRHGAGERR